MLAWRPRSKTTRVIVHSSHFPPSVQSHTAHMRARGREMGLLEVGYHFVIERSGHTVVTRDCRQIGSHTPGNNHDSIAVCLAGDAASGHTPAQEETLVYLLCGLMVDFGRLQVVGHTELQRYRNRELRCPALDMDRLRAVLEDVSKEFPIMDTPPAPAPAPKLTPQQQLILDYLKAGRTLTTKVAIVSLGIMSVSSRVAELRAMGHEILDTTATDHFDRQYKKYRLAGAKEVEEAL